MLSEIIGASKLIVGEVLERWVSLESFGLLAVPEVYIKATTGIVAVPALLGAGFILGCTESIVDGLTDGVQPP